MVYGVATNLPDVDYICDLNLFITSLNTILEVDLWNKYCPFKYNSTSLDIYYNTLDLGFGV